MRRRATFVLTAALLCFALLRCTSDARIGGDDPDAGSEAAPTSPADSSSAQLDAGVVPQPDASASSVQGVYSLLIKAGPNGCAFSPWTEGSVASADATLIQIGSSVTGEVQGFAAVTFGLLLGTTKLQGAVVGSTLTLVSTGVTMGTIDAGTCAYTVDARITATAKGDALQDGAIVYTRNFGGNVQCAPFACTSVATMTGLRSTIDQ